MKKILLIIATLMLTHAAFSQGTVVFGNRGGTGTASAPGETIAPVYGLAADNSRTSGNTAAGIPAGSTSYGTIPYLATDSTHTFSATLYGLDAALANGSGYNNNLQPLLLNNGTAASATFRTSTSGTFAGIWNQPTAPAVVPGVTLDTQRATFQVRVWDTRSGQITSWSQ